MFKIFIHKKMSVFFKLLYWYFINNLTKQTMRPQIGSLVFFLWHHQPCCGCNRWWNMTAVKISQLSAAGLKRDSSGSPAVCLIPTFYFTAQFSKCSQTVTGARLCFCEICSDILPGRPPRSPPPSSVETSRRVPAPLGWDRESEGVRNNGSKVKDGETGNRMRGDKVCEWKKMIHILRSDKLLQSWRRTKSQHLAFGSNWRFKCRRAKWKLSYSVSHVSISSPRSLCFLCVVTLCSSCLTCHRFPTDGPH